MSRASVKKLIDFLYVHNPFYLISAGLFVYGLKFLFRPETSTILFQQGSVDYIEPWGLLASLAGVTILMTATAVLIVRLGKVWEDARSLILIVLLMLFAMTVSMDELLNLLADRSNPARHVALMFCLMAIFSIGTVEGLLRGLSLKLPAGYRIPLHLLLLVMIAWPIILLPEIADISTSQIQKRIAAFPIACGLLMLTLLPAVWKGSSSVQHTNGPWTWPLYPWTAFGFLLLAVCLRSYSLTMSFDVLESSGHYWDTSFGLWQLTPILIAAMVILLEIGIREDHATVKKFCMLTAPMLLPLSAPWIVPWSRFSGFHAATSGILAGYPSPVYCTLLCLILIYARARYKGVVGAQLGLIGMIVLSTAINPDSFHSHQQTQFAVDLTAWPLLAFAIFDLIVSLKQKSAARIFLSSLLLTTIAYSWLRIWPPTSHWAVTICMHLLLAEMIMVACLSKSDFSQAVTELTPLILVLITIATAVNVARELGPTSSVIYVSSMIMFAAATSRILSWKAMLAAAQFMAAICGLIALVLGIRYVYYSPLPKGVHQLMLAVFSFVMAVIISAWKAGLGRRWRLKRRLKQRRSRLSV